MGSSRPMAHSAGRAPVRQVHLFQGAAGVATPAGRPSGIGRSTEFREVVEGWAERNLVRCYSTVGTRGDADFMIWQVSYELDDIQRMAERADGHRIGRVDDDALLLPLDDQALATTSRSTRARDGPLTRLSLAPGEHKYLFVYPLTKAREWYGLPTEERQEAMNQHIAIGATYSSVKLNTTYSFGLDDQEFVLAFETDEPGDFLDLVQELRRLDVQRLYPDVDVPIFTCVAVTAGGDARGARSAARQAVGAYDRSAACRRAVVRRRRPMTGRARSWRRRGASRSTARRSGSCARRALPARVPRAARAVRLPDRGDDAGTGGEATLMPVRPVRASMGRSSSPTSCCRSTGMGVPFGSTPASARSSPTRSAPRTTSTGCA